MILNDSESSCSQGCLRCVESECQICDFQANYFLVQGFCVQTVIDNCYLKGIEGCLQCAANYLLDNKKCVAVDSNSQITNCLYYDGSSCIQCIQHYILSNGACTKVTKQIENCLLYDADGEKCLECNNSIPDLTFSSCITSPQIDNCSKFTFLKCLSCTDDHFLVENSYLQNLSNNIKEDKNYYLQILQSTKTTLYKQGCMAITIDNCATLLTFNMCKECADGYYLDNNSQCQEFPEEEISNCEIYASASECSECDQKYWLEGIDNCADVVEIDYCKTYSNVEESVCEECQSDYFLQDNICYAREVSLNILNCKTVFIYLDQCQECNVGFETNIDYTQCLSSIKNCKTHSKTKTALSCQECNQGFYLYNEGCYKGSISGCSVYSSQTVCLECEQGQWMDEYGVCQTHSLSPYILCSEFSTTEQNLCESCISTKVKYDLDNICVKVTPIQNCDIYEDESNCAVCDSSLSYLVDGACILGTVTYCTEYDPTSNMCINCGFDATTQYGLVPNKDAINNSCSLNNPNLYQNCGEISEEPDKLCLYCNEGYYQKQMTDTNLQYCVPRTYYTIKGQNNLSNCNLYDQVNQACLSCQIQTDGTQYVINNSGGCISSCPSSQSILTFELEDDHIKKNFVCKNSSYFAGDNFTHLFSILYSIKCFRYEIDMSDQSRMLCAQCDANYIGVIDATIDEITGYRYQYLLTTSFKSSLSDVNVINSVKSCLSRTVATQTSQNGTKLVTPISGTQTQNLVNCKFLQIYDESTETYYCSSCKFGYTGAVGKSSGTNFVYLMEQCQIMTSCKTDTWINGLGVSSNGSVTQFYQDNPLAFDYLVSCHQCKDSTLIPTFGVTIMHKPNITAFTTNQYQNMRLGQFGLNIDSSSTSAPYTFASQKASQTTCQTPGLTKALNFPANCAVQMVNVLYPLRDYKVENEDPYIFLYNNTANDDSYSYSNPVCIACQPGYAPTVSTVNPMGIDKCTKIENCLSSNAFNRCEQCAVGYTFEETNTGLKCVTNTTAPLLNNCLVRSSATACSICSKGYILDDDNKCKQIQQYNCSTPGFYSEYFASMNNNYRYLSGGIGCLECSTDYILVQFQDSLQMCVKNANLSLTSQYQTIADVDLANNNLSVISYLIRQCKNYFLNDGELQCYQCQDGYILQSDFLACYLQSNFTNCDVVQKGGSRCTQCSQGYYFNTQTYQCTKGNISNCQVYENAQKCITCIDGYIATNIQGDKTLCLSVNDFNCATYDLSLALKGILNCTKCKQDKLLISSQDYGEFPLIQCLTIPSITNCLTYKKSSISVTNSSLKCTSCKSGYYLDDQTCKSRTIDENCLTYEITANYCKDCVTHYYFNPTSKKCKANPFATQGCIRFSSESTCTLCEEQMYLKNNMCYKVSTVINNCKYYRNSFECQQCDANYYLNGDTCEQALALNCKTFNDSQNCATCYEGYGLSKSGTITSCVKITVSNCMTPDSTSIGPNFECSQCNKYYYKNSSGTCTAVSSEISDCLYYGDAATKCVECDSNFILSSDQTSCYSYDFLGDYQDDQCSNYQLKYDCSICDSGYVFNDEGECTVCDVSNRCMFCDPNDISQCILCNTGYYMNVDGHCVLNAETSEETDGSSSYCFLIVLQFLILLNF